MGRTAGVYLGWTESRADASANLVCLIHGGKRLG